MQFLQGVSSQTFQHHFNKNMDYFMYYEGVMLQDVITVLRCCSCNELFKEFSSDAGSYKRKTLVDRPDHDHCSLGASLHILLKKNGSSAKEKDKNNSKNINLFMYKNLCKIYSDYLKIDRGIERFLPLF